MVVVILTWEIRDIRVALISFPSWIKMLTIFHVFIIHSFIFFDKRCSVASILLTGLVPFIIFWVFIMYSRLLSPCQMNGWEGFSPSVGSLFTMAGTCFPVPKLFDLRDLICQVSQFSLDFWDPFHKALPTGTCDLKCFLLLLFCSCH